MGACPVSSIYTLDIDTYQLSTLFIIQGAVIPSAGATVFFGTGDLSDNLFIVGGYNQNNLTLWPPDNPCSVDGDDLNCTSDDYITSSFETKNIISIVNVSTLTATSYTDKMTNPAVYSAFAQKDNDVYFYGGESGNNTSTLTPSSQISHLDLNNVTTTGMDISNMPDTMPALFGQSAVYGLDDTVYLFGGDNKVYTHDISSDILTSSQDLSAFKDRTVSAYGQTDTDGYILGGDDGNTIVKYHFADRSYSNLGTLTEPLSGRGIYAGNGKIYFFGGENKKAVYEFNPVAPSLIRLQDSGSDLLYNDCEPDTCTAVYDSTGDRIIIASGSIVQEYTPGDTTVLTSSSTLENSGTGIFTDGFWSDGKAYFVSNSASPKCYAYNPTNKTSSSLTCPTFANSNNQISNYNSTAFTFQNAGAAYYLGPSEPGNGFSNIFRLDFGTDSISSRKASLTIPTIIDRTTNVLAEFYDSVTGYSYIPMNDGNVIIMNLNVQSEKNAVSSTKINSGTAEIAQATLTAVDSKPTGTSIEYKMSSDGGTNWETVQNGEPIIFSHVGTELLWKAVLTAVATDAPKITNISIAYFGQQSSLYIADSQGNSRNSYFNTTGQISQTLNVGLRDSSGTSTIATKDLQISLSSDSASAKLSTNGKQWRQSLSLTIREGQEFAIFYAVALAPEQSSVTIHCDGMSDINFIIRGDGPGGYKSNFSFYPNPPVATVGSPITISADTSYRSESISIDGTTSFSSSQNDSMPTVNTNDSGAVIHSSSTIYSTVAGERTISLLFNNAGTSYLFESPQKLIFLPTAISSIRLNSSSEQTVKAGEIFTLSASLFDKYGNLGTNSTDSITLSSTDPTFSTSTFFHKFVPSDAGNFDFTDIVLRTAGNQTITVKDSNTGASESIDITVLSSSPFDASSKITSDKTKLVLNRDKAKITIRIADPYGNGVGNIPVHIKNALSYGTLDKFDSRTDSSGIATFIYTPTKEGIEDFHAYTDTFALTDTLTIETVADTLMNKIGSIIDTLQNNAIAKTIANAANAVAATAATLGLIPMIASVIGSAPAAAHAIAYAFSLGLEAIGIRKRRRSWGRVYDSTTGKGIDMATVRLFDQKSMKLVGTVVTDLKGHFSFQPTPGTYTISVIKDSYVFPTNIFAKYGIAAIDKSSSRISSHYVGQSITVTSDNNLINLDIPVDPHSKKATLLIRAKIFLSDLFEIVTSGLSYIFLPSIITGSLVSVFAAVILPTHRNITICLVYIIMVAIYVISHLSKIRKFSIVYDSKDKKPIPEAVVSVFDKNYDTLKETRITDKFGRFSISVPKGNYRFKVEREGFVFPSTKTKKHSSSDGKYSNLYFGEMLEAKQEKFINVSVPMDPKYGELTIK